MTVAELQAGAVWSVAWVPAIAALCGLGTVFVCLSHFGREDFGANNRYLTVGLRHFTTSRVGRLMLESLGPWWRPRLGTPSGRLEDQ
jgi:hypothetical protein